jgi:hypothetical protein
MKRSNVWFVSILITSALLPSAANNAVTKSLARPSQSLTQQRNSASQDAQTNAKPKASLTRIQQAPSSQSSPAESGENGDQNAGRLRKIWEWIAGMSAQGLFNFIMAIATILLAIFTGQLVCVTRDLNEATSAAAMASEAALHAERPILVIMNIKANIVYVERLGGRRLFADIQIRNCGKGPAIIKKAIFASELFGSSYEGPSTVSFPTDTIEHSRGAVIEEGTTVWWKVVHVADEPKVGIAIARKTTTLGFYGEIIYRGPVNRTYRTPLFYWYALSDGQVEGDQGHFLYGPDRLNEFD